MPILPLAAMATDPSSVLPVQLRSRARSEPDRPFLREVTGGSTTYGTTWDGVCNWAEHLKTLGVGPGSRVTTLLPPSIDAVMIWIALGCLGAVEVPVNPDLKGAFLEHVLDDAAPMLCLARPEFADRVRDIRPDLPVRGIERGAWENLDAAGTDLGTLPSPGDLACVIYTSGSTGPAKGMMLDWAQFATTIDRIPLGPDDVTYNCHPMFHVTGRSPLITMCSTGGSVVLREKFSAKATLDDVRAFGCTTGTFHGALLLALPPRADDADNPLEAVFAGHNAALAAEFAKRFAVKCYDLYGSTEVGFPLVLSDPPDLEHTWCGRVRDGYRAQVVDEIGQPVADGVPGELWVRPDDRLMIMIGYLNQPEATARALDGGWYHSDDIVIRHPDGNFEFLHRAGDTIRRMGENISTTAVEAVIDEHPQLSGCAVLGVPDNVAGHEVVVVAEVVENSALGEPALYEWLTSRLPKHTLPRYLALTDALPRTPTNKVLKTGLLDTIDLAEAWSPPSLRR
ncbi:AMP-binding protein [Rhodococcus chondri]|uniref:AMP-binding protein n=1 Tax=Rhodococcus chondri TaxID=3065941 RepID=A0ABU7JV70_9NOCA|nr:AMP-binding protein [Rhodococcus sp. CC-R104]MEE2033730.1 AMP-binding protein [Rhodococcus sp. CC-R104]